MIIDVRLVQDRDGRWRASLEGRRVPRVDGDSPSAAMDALARALEGAAWLARTSEHEAACAAHGPLFEVSPPGDDTSRSRKDGTV